MGLPYLEGQTCSRVKILLPIDAKTVMKKKAKGRGPLNQQMIRQMMKSRWWSHNRQWNSGLQKRKGKSERASQKKRSTIRSLRLCCGKLRRKWKKRKAAMKKDPILRIRAPRFGRSKKTKRLLQFKDSL